MQIVIDIPDRFAGLIGFTTPEIEVIVTAVLHGTPLPKGHGRIIDYGYVVDAIDDWINAEEYRYTNATDYLRNRIRNVPTIIEADKESEVEE